MTPNITLRSSSGKPIAELPLSKFATPHTEKEFIHIDRLPDGTWRLLFNVRGPDGKQINTATEEGVGLDLSTTIKLLLEIEVPLHAVDDADAGHHRANADR